MCQALSNWTLPRRATDKACSWFQGNCKPSEKEDGEVKGEWRAAEWCRRLHSLGFKSYLPLPSHEILDNTLDLWKPFVWLQLTLELVKMFGGASSVMRKLVAVVISSVAISELLSVWGSVGGSGKKWACCSSQSSIWAQSEGAFAVPGRKDHGCSQGVETNRHARSNQSHIIYAWV